MARTKPHVFLQMKKERKMQQKEKRKNHASPASAMSQNEDYGKDSDDAGDAVCMDDLVHVEGYNKAGKEGEDSDMISDNEVTETANLAIKVLTEFQKWLISPDGEKKDVKTAKQHAAQLKNILSIVGGGTRLEPLLDAKTIRDVFPGEHAAGKYSPDTVQPYLMSLQHVCSFVLEDRPTGVVFNTDNVMALRNKFKRWSVSYKRDTTRRRWEKHEEEVSFLITPEKINEFVKSQASRDAVSYRGPIVWW